MDKEISKCAFHVNGPRSFGTKTKVNVFFPPPKQPGFVGVCQSCQEEAPVGETPFAPFSSERSFCVCSCRKRLQELLLMDRYLVCSSSVTTSLKNWPWMFMMKWTEGKLMQVEFKWTCEVFLYSCWSCKSVILYFPVWLATQNHSTLVTDTTVVPFLPVNPEYSSTRNQASPLTRTPPG